MQLLRKFSRRLFFNLIYFFNPPWDTGISPPELQKFVETHAPGRALDLGCGTGTNVIFLAKNGWQAVGVDFASRAIGEARQKASRAGLGSRSEFHVDDVTRLEGISGPFDLVLDIGCYHSLSTEKRPAYRQNLSTLLAPGGTYLMYSFFKKDLDTGGSGITTEEVRAFQNQLKMVQREDGTERGVRASAWFTFIKENKQAA